MATLGTLEYLISIKDNGIESQLNKTEKTVKKSGDKINSWMIAKGQMIGRFAEKAIATTGRIAKKSAELVKSAVDSFADFQQLEGGVNKLFGKDAVTVINNASKAYLTAGKSMNEYMQSVTEFSAALIDGLGGDTAEAARIADQAMVDMSDNANMFGSSLESIQNAYRGFSKQQYMMLDNLKLGYGGTKTEMQRLLKDAEAYQKSLGKSVKYNIKNLGDVYEAIHAIQEKLLITGTTEHEALETVSGSFMAAKAAWKDVLTSIGRGKDVKKSIKQFADTAKTYIKNLKPVLKESVSGVFTAIKELLPEFGDMFEGLKKDLKESDVPLLRVLGGVLDTVTKITGGITNLATDFDATVAAMKESDDPFVKLAGGALETARDIIKWIGDHADWVANNIDTIAVAFAGITISKDVLKFLSLLQSSGVLNGLSKLFNLGNGGNGGNGGDTGNGGGGSFIPTRTPTPTTKDGNKLWNFVKTGVKDIVTTGALALPFALFADSLASDQKMVSDMMKKGEELKKAYDEKSSDFAGNDMFNAWDTLTKYTTVGGAEDKAKMKDFARDYMSWFNDEAVNPVLDQLTNAMTDEQFDRFHDVMERMNAGEMFYSDEDVDKVRQAMQDAISVMEAEMKKNPVKPTVDISAMQSQLNSSNLTVDVTPKVVGGGIFAKLFGQAKGDWSVPYDNYPSLLHRGEMVLNQSQARRYRDGETGNESTVNLPSVIARSVKESMKQVNFLLNGNKVADFTTKRTNRNIRAQSYSTLKAYGG